MSQAEPIAVVAANFRADPIEEPLRFWLHGLRLAFRPLVTCDMQVERLLLDPNSAVNRDDVGAVVVLLLIEQLVPSDVLSSTTELLRRQLLQAVEGFGRSLADCTALQRGLPCALVVTPPTPALLRHIDGSVVHRDAVARLDLQVRSIAGVVLSTSDQSQLAGADSYYDEEGHELACLPYTQRQFVMTATLVARRLRAFVRPPRKAIVVDCDGVLWSGSCAESGTHGVTIDSRHAQTQRYLVEQARAGVAVCLCSKNSEGDVLSVFEQRSDMLLRLDDVTTWRIGWDPKSASIAAIARQLQAELSSIVFIDDNPIECAEVRSSCPEVLTLCWSGELPDGDLVNHLWAFDRGFLTSEDRRRVELLRAADLRSEAAAVHASYGEFLRDLRLELEVGIMAVEDANRVAQLTVRTTQFNTTGRRRTSSDLLALAAGGSGLCLTATLRDRFGDYGLIGGVVVQLERRSGSRREIRRPGAPDRGRAPRTGASLLVVGERGPQKHGREMGCMGGEDPSNYLTDALAPDTVFVDSIFVSCRALGRGVEHHLLQAVGVLAAERSIGSVEVAFEPTSRNEPARRFVTTLPGTIDSAANGSCVVRMTAVGAAALTFDPDLAPGPTVLDRESCPAADMTSGENALLQAIAERTITPETVDRMLSRDATSRVAPARHELPSDWGSLERQLGEMWLLLLQVPRLGLHDNFFALGGDSLTAFQLLARIQQRFEVEVEANLLFETDLTIASLAIAVRGHLAQRERSERPDPIMP